ncbi:hypothetical protein C9E85_03975 [Plesiomonas shigelloides]|nr:hypothetical protein C7R88_08770 [Plesiomonas shigelloides]PVU67172.1 hypothetical protein C9E85_03975 [Plesiomonas shigelloides]
MLATFAHPNHIVCLCAWGFTHLPPSCNFTLFGYNVRLSGYYQQQASSKANWAGTSPCSLSSGRKRIA